MKKCVLSLILIVFVLISLLPGCSQNKDDVKLAGKIAIIQYARQKYGKAEFLGMEEEQYKRVCTFRDKEYGFTYQVTSYVSALSIDGSIFGYTEEKTTDFPHIYFRRLYDTVLEKLGNDYNLSESGTVNNGSFFCHLSNLTKDNAAASTEAVAKEFLALDKRHFFSDSVVRAYSGENKGYIGSYHLDERKFILYADEYIDQMTAHANSYVNRVGMPEKKITYLYYAQMDISEVPGLDKEDLVHHTIDDGTLVTLYYFDIDGRKYFFADVQVWKVGNEYYTNYTP